jgi:hypothetical protein
MHSAFREGFEKCSLDMNSLRKAHAASVKPILSPIHINREAIANRHTTLVSHPKADVHTVYSSPDLIHPSGRGGTVKALERSIPPMRKGLHQFTPEQKEVVNRLSDLHEVSEIRHTRKYPTSKFFGHSHPGVILDEGNMVASLSPDIGRAGNVFTRLRQNVGEAGAIESALPGYVYGQTRLSRHGKKHALRILEEKGFSK